MEGFGQRSEIAVSVNHSRQLCRCILDHHSLSGHLANCSSYDSSNSQRFSSLFLQRPTCLYKQASAARNGHFVKSYSYNFTEHPRNEIIDGLRYLMLGVANGREER